MNYQVVCSESNGEDHSQVQAESDGVPIIRGKWGFTVLEARHLSSTPSQTLQATTWSILLSTYAMARSVLQVCTVCVVIVLGAAGASPRWRYPTLVLSLQPYSKYTSHQKNRSTSVFMVSFFLFYSWQFGHYRDKRKFKIIIHLFTP